MNPQSVKCLTHSQQLPRVVWSWGFNKGCFTPLLVIKGRLHKALGPISARQLRPYKAETAVHGCHYLGDMAVRMPDRGSVFERVTFIVRKELPLL